MANLAFCSINLSYIRPRNVQLYIILILIIRSVLYIVTKQEVNAFTRLVSFGKAEVDLLPFLDYSGKVNGERDFAEDICDFLCFAAFYIMVNRGFSCYRLKITRTRERKLSRKIKLPPVFRLNAQLAALRLSRRGTRPFARRPLWLALNPKLL